MRTDITIKRGQFISKVNSLLQEFHYCSRETMIKLITSYCCAFYGSPLWNLRSKEADRLFKSWNVTIRCALKLDRQTHRNLIEPLSECSHLKVMLASRLVKFYRSLIESPKFTIRFLARIASKDMRTVLGSTLEYLRNECKLETVEILSLTLIKKNLVYAKTTPDSEWMERVAKEMLDVRNNKLDLIGFDDDEIKEILTFACTA